MRSKTAAGLGSLLFFVVAPGTVVGVVPWLLTGWEAPAWLPSYWVVLAVLGWLLVAAGVYVLAHAFVRFVVEGIGTPAPVAPTEHLVVGGFHRYVRNPMYVALLAIILGQALVFANAALVAYAACAWVVAALFVRWYEEPTLLRQFGSEYEEYRRGVPAWLPRVRPWQAEGARRA